MFLLLKYSIKSYWVFQIILLAEIVRLIPKKVVIFFRFKVVRFKSITCLPFLNKLSAKVAFEHLQIIHYVWFIHRYVWIIHNYVWIIHIYVWIIHILYESYICMNVEIKKNFLVILKMYDSIHTYVWFIHNMYDFVHTYVWIIHNMYDKIHT